MSTTLQAGDIAIIGVNMDGTPGANSWAFVPLVNLAAGTTIHFTDAGYDSDIDSGSNRFVNDNNSDNTPDNDESSDFTKYDGHMTWVVPSAINAGTTLVVTNNKAGNATIVDTENTSYTGVTGTVGGTVYDFYFMSDNLFIYQGTQGTTLGATFIYGWANSQTGNASGEGVWYDGANSVSGNHFISHKPEGLVEGTSAIALTTNDGMTGTSVDGKPYGYDNMQYKGIKTGTQAELLAAIGKPENWEGNDSTVYTLANIGNFSAAPAGNSSPSVNSTHINYAVAEGGKNVIRADQLSASDPDSNDADLIFTITTPVSNGTLWLDSDGDQTLDEGEELGQDSTFIMQNITDSMFYYTHNDSETTSDSFGFSVSDGEATLTDQTFNITVVSQNDAPTLSDVDATSYSLGSEAIILDSDLTIGDPEKDLLNEGNGDYQGAQLILKRQGGVNADDEFGFGPAVTVTNNNAVYNLSLDGGSTTIATISALGTADQLIINFSYSGAIARAQAEALMEAITYRNIGNTQGEVTLEWQLWDNAGSGGLSVTVPQTITLSAQNAAPTFSGTGTNPTFTELLNLENETLQSTNLTYLFTGSDFDTIESGQEITQVTLTVTNVVDQIDGDAAEYLLIGANLGQSVQIALQNGNTGSSSTPELTYSVTVDQSHTATVVINSADEAAVWEQYAGLLAYFNASQNPTAGERVVTITSVKDDGGTEDGGQDTATGLTVSSTVTVVAVNDAPTFSAIALDPTFKAGDFASAYLFSNAVFDTVEPDQLISQVTLSISNVTDSAEELGFGRDAPESSGYMFGIQLQNGLSNTVDGHFSYTVTVTGTTAIVELTGDKTAAEWNTYLGNLYYQNNSQTMTEAVRVVNVTGVQDNGGTDNNGVDTNIDVTATSSVTVQGPNQAPSLTATGDNQASFTEDGDAVSLFSEAAADTNNLGDAFAGLTLTVTNVANGEDEVLNIDGSEIALVAGNGTTTTNSLTYAVTVENGTATVTLSGGNLTAEQLQTLVNGISYQNNADAPTIGNDRSISISQIKDTGGVENNGEDTTDLNGLSATVAITAVNDAPSITDLTATSYTLGATAAVLDSDLTIADPELDALNSGNGDYQGAQLILARQGGANAQDDFGFSDAVTVTDNNLSLDGGTTTMATFSENAGELTIHFSTGGAIARVQAEALMEAITYRNTGDTTGEVTLVWQLWDSAGSGGLSVSVPQTMTLQPDTTAPTFDETPLVANASLENDSLDLTVDTNEAGTIYYVVQHKGAGETWTAAEIKAGQNQSNDTGVASGSRAVSEGEFSHTFNITGLENVAYDIYIVAEDGAGNLQVTPTRIDGTLTTDGIFTIENDSTTDTVNEVTMTITSGQSAPYIGSNAQQGTFVRTDGEYQFSAPINLSTIDILPAQAGSLTLSAQTSTGGSVEKIITLNGASRQTVSVDLNDIVAFSLSSYVPVDNVVFTKSLRLDAVSSTPADDGTVTDGSANIVLKFSEAIKNHQTTLIDILDSDGEVVEQFTANGLYTLAGNKNGIAMIEANTLTLNPGVDLSNGDYYLHIYYADSSSAGLVSVGSNAPLGEIKDETTFNFTVDEPVVTPPAPAPVPPPAPAPEPPAPPPVPAPEPPAPPAPPPAPPQQGEVTLEQNEQTVDGIKVINQVVQLADGTTTERLLINPISSERQEDSATPNSELADIPLFWGESSRSEFATTASLPVGVGIETQGARAPIEGRNANDAIGDLVGLIDQTAPGADPTRGDMLNGAESFLQNLAQQSTETLVINKITLTSQPDIGASSAPIVISGTAQPVTTPTGQVSAPVEALVIDARSLPAGSEINLENIEFAVIIGDNVTVRGGEGANIFYAGAGSQNIRLGADDDILYAGEGDDWVGSEGGDDQLFGESGHDVLYGGTGDDVLDGGEGIDFALYQYARAEYSVGKLDNGAWQISHAIEGTDTLINIEYAEFADQTLRLADNDGANLMQSGLLFF